MTLVRIESLPEAERDLLHGLFTLRNSVPRNDQVCNSQSKEQEGFRSTNMCWSAREDYDSCSSSSSSLRSTASNSISASRGFFGNQISHSGNDSAKNISALPQNGLTLSASQTISTLIESSPPAAVPAKKKCSSYCSSPTMTSYADARFVQPSAVKSSGHLDQVAVNWLNSQQGHLSHSKVKPMRYQTPNLQHHHDAQRQQHQQERSFLSQLEWQREHGQWEQQRHSSMQPGQQYHQVYHHGCQEHNHDRNRQLWYQHQHQEQKQQFFHQPQHSQWQWHFQHAQVFEHPEGRHLQQLMTRRMKDLLLCQFHYGRQQRQEYQERIQELNYLLLQREQEHREMQEREQMQRERRNAAAADALARAFGHLSQPLIADQVQASKSIQRNGSNGEVGGTIMVKRDDGKMRRRDLATGKYYIGAYSPIARIARLARFHAARRQRIAAGTAREHAGRLLPDSKVLVGKGACQTTGNYSNNLPFTTGKYEKSSFIYGRKIRTEGVRAERMIRYEVRKQFANSRMRVKGRFVKKEDEELLRDALGLA